MASRLAVTLTLVSLALAGLAACGRNQPQAPPAAGDQAGSTAASGTTDDLAAERVTQERMLQLANAFEDEAAARRAVPEVKDAGGLAQLLSHRGVTAGNLVDGWGRPFEVAMKDGLLEIRSLGRDGIPDQGELLGATDDPDADIVIVDGTFEQWHPIQH